MAFLSLLSRQHRHHEHQDGRPVNVTAAEAATVPTMTSSLSSSSRRRHRGSRRGSASGRGGVSVPAVAPQEAADRDSSNNQSTFRMNGPPPPASKAFMNSLLHLRIRNVPSTSSTVNSSTDVECIICAQPYEELDVVCSLPCGHMYHSHCIESWLERRCTCPTCRCEYPTDDPVYEHHRRQRLCEGSKSRNAQIDNCNDDAASTDDDSVDHYYDYQDDFMFLPPNLSVPLDDDEHGSSSSSSSSSNDDLNSTHEQSLHHHHHGDDDFFHQNENFDLIMRRVLRSKAKLREQKKHQHRQQLQL